MADGDLILGPRVQEPCEAAPQKGVHVYHFPFSSCSQMVRFGLCAKNVADWESHVMDIFSAMEHLEPAYARINPRCVVPTLVVDGKVTTDTKTILDEIDKLPGGGRLMPADPAEAETVKSFLDKAGKIQLQVITFGSLPGLDPETDPAAKKVDSVAKRRAELVSGHLAANSEDPFLKSVYEAKLQALSILKDNLSSPETVKGAMEVTVALLDEVEEQLKNGTFSKGGWLASMELSAADVMWSVMINRFAWKGLAATWLEPRPNILAYMVKIKEHPAWKEGVAKYLS